jgi:hypothetical protein
LRAAIIFTAPTDHNMRISGKLIIACLGLTVLTACGHSNTKEDANTRQPHDMRDPAQELRHDLEQIYNCTVIFADSVQADGTCTAIIARPRSSNPYFYSDTAVTLSVARFRLQADTIGLLHSKPLRQLEWTYLDIDSASIRTVQVGSKPYVYFEAREEFMGKAITERHVVFYLTSLKDGKAYALGYTGHNDFKCEECLVGTFDADQGEWKGPAAVYEALIAQSASSKLIYHPGPDDEDLYAWQHYETKWTADNGYGPDENALGAGHIDPHTPIHSTYYTTDLFRLNRGSAVDSIENEHYKVISYFRSNLVSYDKQKKLYFPVIIEGCNYSCSKDIALLSQDRIRIRYEDPAETPLELSLSEDIIFDAVTGK